MTCQMFHTVSRMWEKCTYSLTRGRAYPTRGDPLYSTHALGRRRFKLRQLWHRSRLQGRVSRNKPIEAEELTEKELEDVSGGMGPNVVGVITSAVAPGVLITAEN